MWAWGSDGKEQDATESRESNAREFNSETADGDSKTRIIWRTPRIESERYNTTVGRNII